MLASATCLKGDDKGQLPNIQATLSKVTLTLQYLNYGTIDDLATSRLFAS